MRTGLLDMRNG